MTFTCTGNWSNQAKLEFFKRSNLPIKCWPVFSKVLVASYLSLDWRKGWCPSYPFKSKTSNWPTDLWQTLGPDGVPFGPSCLEEPSYPFPSHMPDSPPPRATWCRLYIFIFRLVVSKMATSSVSPVRAIQCKLAPCKLSSTSTSSTSSTCSTSSVSLTQSV